MGEVTALFYAESLCRELGIHEVIYEGDAKQVVDAINSNTSKWSRGHTTDVAILIKMGVCFHQTGGEQGGT
jgi:ribonuclease HI